MKDWQAVRGKGLAERASRWLVGTVCILAVSACSQAPDLEALRLQAIDHLDRGDQESALWALRSAMSEAPDDPALRLLAARAYLESGRGDLAEVALQQAVNRGAQPSETAVLHAEALFVQERYLEVRNLDWSEGLPMVDAVQIELLQARALGATRQGTGTDEALTRAYLALFERFALLPELDPVVRKIGDAFAQDRSKTPEAERAWQHFACRTTESVLFRWQPAELGERRVLRVGPAAQFRTPAAAAAVARDGDAVLIEPGHYPGGVALWAQNDLLVRGSGGRPLVTADGRGVEQRDVWLFTGNHVTVENVEISGARSPWQNGAGIRHVGRGLIVRHVRLVDNENGLLTGNRHEDGEILIEFSEFLDNGDGRGQAHNAYIGRSGKLTFRFNHSQGARGGHLLKSRARDNRVLYNRLTDGDEGSSSYLIDLPEGGTALVLGNELEQSGNTQNHRMVSFAAEGMPHATNVLTMASNSVYNRDHRGIVVRNHGPLPVRLVNNLIGGAPAQLAEGLYEAVGNLTFPDHGMEDPRRLEFGLVSGAAAIDKAVDSDVLPEFEYEHPLRYRSRTTIWRPDVGAHEKCGI